MGRRDVRVAGTQTLRDKVATALRKAIVDGVYAPGDPLGEIELARRFRVSRGPVREAIIQLQNEFLVRSYPNRGAFVYQLSQREFDEILELRGQLEPLALRHARANATPEHLELLREALAELEAQASADDSHEIAEKDFQFHNVLWEMSARPLLQDLLLQISRPMFVFFRINWTRYQRAGLDFRQVAASHRALLDYVSGAPGTSAEEAYQVSLDGGAVKLHA
jgi:DNA-binding GntR family transcriptional regulator